MKNRSLIRWVTILILSALCVTLGIAVFRSRETAPHTEDKAPQSVSPRDDLYTGVDPHEGHSPVDEWVGSQKCAECHQEIQEKYQGHPMAHSAALVSDPSTIEDYRDQISFSKPESRTYLVERRDGRVFHHEKMTDESGAVIYDQAVEVHFALGSGKRGRSYVIDRDGVLFQSPISWYTSAGRWDLSPGYRPRTHQRFDRRVTGSCLHCHVGRVADLPDRPDRFHSPAVREYAIGCERCHGPGREHVRFHEQGGTADGSTRDPIVQPARLEPAPREDVCNQCHLQGQRLLRAGRSEYDFRPGQRLEDVWTIYPREEQEEAPAPSTLRAVGHVEQMRDSVCFQKSAGRLGCISCHDPHSVPVEENKLDDYKQRCLVCHESQGCAEGAETRNAPPANGSCISCHMPALAARDVPHTSQTDHRILRRPDAPPPARERDPLALFDDADSRLPPYDVKRARSLYLAERLLKKPDAKKSEQLETALREVLAEERNDAPVLFSLGQLRMAQRHPQEAGELWRRLIELSPEHEGGLQRMALLERDQGRLPESLALMERYARINPWLAEFHALMAQLHWQAREPEEAIAAARRGLELDPRMLPIRTWLARALQQMGRTAEAREQLEILERMQGR